MTERNKYNGAVIGSEQYMLYAQRCGKWLDQDAKNGINAPRIQYRRR